jgi:hypothetical protein
MKDKLNDMKDCCVIVLALMQKLYEIIECKGGKCFYIFGFN